MKKFPSKLSRAGAGALAPASQCGNRFPILLPVLAAAAALSWQSGITVGQLLGLQRFPHAHDALPALESLAQQVTATLREQGVCLDAPSAASAPDADTASQIDSLRDRFAILTPCVDLAIAQNDFEALQLSSATLGLIHRSQSLTTGFIADTLAFRYEQQVSRSRRAKSKSLQTNTGRRTAQP